MSFMSAASLFAEGESFLPRFRHVSDLTLDLFHHDGRVEDRWLGLEPHEFELLWRLAKQPRPCLSHRALMTWAQDQNGFERAVERLLAKLGSVGLAGMLTRHPAGCYCLEPPPEPEVVA